MAEGSQRQLKDIKKQLQDVNWSRKHQQSGVGDKLRQLESEWVGLVSKNYEIEQALAKMEAEIQKLPNGGREYFDQFEATTAADEPSEEGMETDSAAASDS